MKWLWFAVKNVRRNRRRSATTALIAAVGTASLLVGGGFVEYIYALLRRIAATDSGHVVLAHRDYFAMDEDGAPVQIGDTHRVDPLHADVLGVEAPLGGGGEQGQRAPRRRPELAREVLPQHDLGEVVLGRARRERAPGQHLPEERAPHPHLARRVDAGPDEDGRLVAVADEAGELEPRQGGAHAGVGLEPGLRRGGVVEPVLHGDVLGHGEVVAVREDDVPAVGRGDPAEQRVDVLDEPPAHEQRGGADHRDEDGRGRAAAVAPDVLHREP